MLPDIALSIDAAPLLIALALKGSVLFVIALAAGSLMSRLPAASRHTMWTVGLAAALVLPVLLLALPSWHVPIIGATNGPTEEVTPDEQSVYGGIPATASIKVETSFVQEPVAASPPAKRLDGRVREAATTLGASLIEATPQLLRDWRLWMGMIWLMGVVGVAARWIMAFSQARRLIHDAEPVADESSLRWKDRISCQLGLDRPVLILKSERLAVPVAWSFGNDAVVLPADWDEWDEERKRVVLTHELAHIARRDGLSQLIAQAAMVVHWFNPLAWVMYSHFLRDREQACDDVVLRSGASASAYAEHLLAVAQRFRQDSLELLAVASMARRGELSGRIESILNPEQSRGPAGLRAAVLAAVVALGLAVPLAAFQPFEAVVVTEASSKDEAPTTWDWSGRMQPGTTLEVYALNGAIDVEQGSTDRASVAATPRHSNFSAARLVVERHGDVVTACVVHDGQETCAPGRAPRGTPRERRNNEVSIQITLPRDVNVKLQTTNGRITTNQLDRNIEARSTNGTVRAASRRGDVAARTTNGNVSITTAGRPDGRTTNGSIEATLLTTSWSGSAELRTTNGSVTVTLPRNPNVDVSARSTNGSIRSGAAGLDIERRRGRGTTASGRLGRGGRELSLQTTNGSITLSVAGERVGDASQRPTTAPATISADLGEDLGLVITESVTTALSALDGLSLSADAMATVDWREINASIAEAMASVDWSAIDREVHSAVDAVSIQEEVTRALSESRIDHRMIDEEIRQALEEARSELEAARNEMEDSRRGPEPDGRR